MSETLVGLGTLYVHVVGGGGEEGTYFIFLVSTILKICTGSH